MHCIKQEFLSILLPRSLKVSIAKSVCCVETAAAGIRTTPLWFANQCAITTPLRHFSGLVIIFSIRGGGHRFLTQSFSQIFLTGSSHPPSQLLSIYFGLFLSSIDVPLFERQLFASWSFDFQNECYDYAATTFLLSLHNVPNPREAEASSIQLLGSKINPTHPHTHTLMFLQQEIMHFSINGGSQITLQSTYHTLTYRKY